MMKTWLIAVVCCVSMGSAWANDRYPSNNRHTDYGRVLEVEPIIETQQRRTPREVCWDQQVRHPGGYSEDESYTGTLLGGVIGGALGNALGNKKRNKQIGAVVGAVLGASIGHDVSQGQRRRYEDPYYTTERRCKTDYDVEYHDKVVGYWVTYKYQGREYCVRTNKHPGKRIPLQVSVVPSYR